MRRLPRSVLFLSLLMVPAIAHANMGVPMLALAWPAQWLALIPIVLVECEIVRRRLSLPFRRVLWPISKANLLSTLLGVPVAWLLMLLPLTITGLGLSLVPSDVTIPRLAQVLIFPLTAAWIGGSSPWEVYLAFVVLTVPFCLASIYIEARILRRCFPALDRSTVHAGCVVANIWSYVLLSILAVGFPLTA